MTPFSQLPLGEVISSLRDVIFILGVLTIGWKIRAWLQPVIEFFKRANEFFDRSEAHIDKVESGMQVLLNNHLSHIQSDLGHLSGREIRGSAYTVDQHFEDPLDKYKDREEV
jgi:hypothetical protein